jgi:hypothetical protein
MGFGRDIKCGFWVGEASNIGVGTDKAVLEAILGRLVWCGFPQPHILKAADNTTKNSIHPLRECSKLLCIILS